jgi:uncharacterized repeat protein (TIGR01451 family)
VKAKVWLGIAMLALGTLLIVIPSSRPIRAAGPWYVAPGGDDVLNDCLSVGAPCATINGAIGKASAGDTIYVAVGTYTGTGNEVVLIDKDITLSGGWDAGFGTQDGMSTVDGEESRRGVTANSGVTATVESFLIENGRASCEGGGNVYSSGTLTVTNSLIRRGSAPCGGGGLHNNQGSLTLDGSTVSDNSGVGTICNNGGTVTANESVISDNPDASINNYGSGIVVLNDCSITGNAGGVLIQSGAVSVNNSTISGNGSSAFGISSSGTLTLSNSTVTDNTAITGGGINSGSSNVTLRNTVLAENTAQDGPDCYGTVGSAGYNLIGDVAGCTFGASVGDQVNISPGLGQLIGVPTAPKYHPLMEGSAAVDAGNPAGCTDHTGALLVTDQRGAARVGRCDIGAYEYVHPGPAAVVSSLDGTPQRVPPLGTFPARLRGVVLDSIGSPVSNTIATFAAPASGPSGTFADTGTITTTAVSDDSGIVVAASFTANGLLGSYTVTATVSGTVTSAHFTLTNVLWFVAPGGDDVLNDCLSPSTPCATINGAIGKASAGDTIYVAVGTYTGAGDEVVLIDKDTTLSGGWDAGFVAKSGVSTVDGEGARRGVTVSSGVTTTIEHVAVQNGAASVSCGGISNNSGSVTLSHSTVSENTATEKGGGICNWGGSMLLDGSTVSDNTAQYGGGIDNSGTLTLDGTSVSGNAADEGGGILHVGGTLTLSDSAIVDNTSTGSGGGIYSQSGVVALDNSTVSGNTVSGDQHAHGAGICSANTALTLDSSTVSDNATTGQGGGISGQSGTVVVRNTLLAGNSAISGRPDCSGDVYSDGYNLIGDSAGCSFWSGVTDLVDVNANIGPLVGHPGYHPLSSDSPAIDVIPPGDCTMAADQRGVPRPQGPGCDIGAYEYAVAGPPATIQALAGTPQRTPPFSTFGQSLQAAVFDSYGAPVEYATVTFVAPASGAGGTFADTGTFTTSAVTGKTGVATAQPFRANELTGSYLVTATVDGVATPATFSLTNLGWYVAPHGSDASDCQTPASACATVDGALGKAGFVAGDTVLVARGTYTDTDYEVVLLDRDARLLGGWNELFTAQSGVSIVDCERGSGRRGLVVNVGVVATVDRFVMRNAYANSGPGLQNSGTLVLENSSVSGNESYGTGGGISNGGSLTLIKCVVSDNRSDVGAGGIQNNGILVLDGCIVRDNSAEGFVGGIRNDGSLTVNESVISGNTATDLGGGIGNFGLLILEGSAVVDNEGGSGGGLYNHGNGTMHLLNSTVSDNHYGGIHVGGGTITLNSCTVGGNAGGGIYSDAGTVTLHNSIVAGNSPDCSGTIGSLGYNLVGDTSGCTFSPAAGDLTNLDADLGPLEGSPGYYPLLPGSPAINAADPAGCTDHLGDPVLEDQRGAPRVGRCDIGAYEVGMTVRKWASGSFLPGSDVGYTIVLGNEADGEIENVSVTDALPASLTYVPGSFSATGGTGREQRGVITWNGTLGAGGGATISFRATVDEGVPNCSSITNRVRVEGQGFGLERQTGSEVPCACGLTKDPSNPVLSVGPSGSWDEDDVRAPVVLYLDGLYRMWYTGDDGSGPSQIGLASSTDGVNWTKEASNPVLSPSESWEEQGIRAGSVVSDGSVYRMWYTGYDSGWVARIGYATSPDGVTWTKYAGNPVLDVGTPGSWEDEDVREPAVVKKDGTYHVWYGGYDGEASRLGHAISVDGITWVRDPANPVLDTGVPGGWDWLDVYGPSIVTYSDTYILWYSGWTLPEAWQTGYALSADGSDWARKGMLIPEGPQGAFDAYSADYASVIVDGDEFEVWYSGHDGARYTIGHATVGMCGESSAMTPPNALYLPLVVRNLNAQYSCRAYYIDNFDNPSSGWPVSDSSSRRYAYVDGQYQIWVKEPSHSWLVTPGAKATDFAVAVSARRASGTRGAYGIIFVINADWSELYEVLVDMDYYSIWRYNNGNWESVRGWTPSGHINTGTNWNRLKVVRDGTYIAFYANDQHLTTIVDSSFSGLRRVGLVAFAHSSGPLDARFDDFALYPASCGPSAAGVEFEMGEPEVRQAPAPPELDRTSSSRGGSR